MVRKRKHPTNRAERIQLDAKKRERQRQLRSARKIQKEAEDDPQDNLDFDQHI